MNLFKFKKNQQGESEKPTIVDLGDEKVSVVTLIKDIIAGDVFLKEAVQKQFFSAAFQRITRQELEDWYGILQRMWENMQAMQDNR